MADVPAILRAWLPADGTWYVARLADPDIQRFTTEPSTTTAADFRAALAGLNHRADAAGFRHEPGRDELRPVGEQTWPVRWYSCGRRASSGCHDRGG